MPKELSFDDDDSIYPVENTEDDALEDKSLPRSHLAEIIDAVEEGQDNFNDDFDDDIAPDENDADDD